MNNGIATVAGGGGSLHNPFKQQMGMGMQEANLSESSLHETPCFNPFCKNMSSRQSINPDSIASSKQSHGNTDGQQNHLDSSESKEIEARRALFMF